MSLGQALLGFGLVAALLTLVPGLDTALVLRATLRGGRSAGAASALGILTGLLVWGAAAAVGLAALLAAFPVGYEVVRWLGAAYLVVLGVRLLVAAMRRRGEGMDGRPAPSGRGSFLSGLTTNLLNPKVGVFYLAAVPQFLVPGVPPLAMGLLLAGVHALLGALWLGLLVLSAGLAARWLVRPVATRTIDGLTGAALVAFGLRTAAESL